MTRDVAEPSFLEQHRRGGALVAWFYDPIYHVNYELYRCPQATLYTELAKRHGIDKEDIGTAPAAAKAIAHTTNTGNHLNAIWIDPKTVDLETARGISILAHETLHQVFFTLIERGLTAKVEEHEAFTYYQQWLLAQCLKHYRTLKRRRPRRRK